MPVLPSAADLERGDQLVGRSWGRPFAAAAAISLLALGAWEGYWRGRGIEPSLSDVDASWSVARDWVDSKSIVLLGTSKMQSAIDPSVFGRELGTEPAIQLAVINASPLPVLEHLAADPRFRGTVVIDVAPRIFFDAELRHEQRARAVLEAYRLYRSSPGERLDARLAMLAESSLVLRRAAFSLRRLMEMWTKPRPLVAPFDRVRFDRFRELDFSRLDLAARRLTQRTILAAGRPVAADGVVALAERTRRAAQAVEGRGGRVVLAFLPISGPARDTEERLFPREDYWQLLVERSGLDAIHFLDHPELAGFECPDGLHLETEQAARFTIAFAGGLGRLD